MEKVIFVIVIISSFILSGCVDTNNQTYDEINYKDGDTKLDFIEEIDRSNLNATIIHSRFYYEGNWLNSTSISYTKNGKNFEGAFIPEIIVSLDWIYNNTEKNSTILCWWDYGHIIEGYCERDAIATFASENLRDTIASYAYLSEFKIQQDVNAKGGWNSKEALSDIVSVFTCFNVSSSEIQDIFHKYNVSYIFTRGFDKLIANIFFKWFDKNTSEYINDYNLSELAKQTLIFQLWSDVYIPYGLELVYSYSSEDIFGNYNVKIFKIK
jgi:hypothetical protein